MGLTAQQLIEHNKGIGGSAGAAAIGLEDAFETQLELWARITGRSEKPDISNVPAVRWGNLLEDVVRREWSEVTGQQVEDPGVTFKHPERPWMVANVDGIVTGLKEGLEVKTASVHGAHKWGETGSQIIPVAYQIQIAHYMAVLGFDRWHVAVLIGGSDFRHYTFERDLQSEATYLRLLDKFWAYVETDTPPPAKTSADVELLNPKDDGSAVEASDEDLLSIERLRSLKEQATLMDREIAALEAGIKSRLGGAKSLIGPDGKAVARWSTVTTSRFDAKAFQQVNADLYGQFLKPSSYRRFTV